MKNQSKTIVCFKIARGGSFNNAGYLHYKAYTQPKDVVNNNQVNLFVNPENWFEIKKRIGDRPNLNEKFDLYDNGGWEFFNKIGMPVGELYYFDANRNPICSVESVESGEFRMEFDGDYNTWYCTDIENCDESELEAIIKEGRDNVERAKELMLEKGFAPAGWYE